GRSIGVHVELIDGRPLGAQGALVMGAAWIAFDVDDLSLDGMNERPAPHRAVRADARGDLGLLDPQLLRSRLGGGQAGSEPGEATERGTGQGSRRSLQEISS